MRILDVRGQALRKIDKLHQQYPARFYKGMSMEHVHRETTAADIQEFRKRAEAEGAVVIFISNYGQTAYIPWKEVPRMVGEPQPVAYVDRLFKMYHPECYNQLISTPEHPKPELEKILYEIKGGHTICAVCGKPITNRRKSVMPQTDRGRITGIKKGKEYWPKVNATQRAILDRMNAGTILEVHSDGDLTFEAEGKQYVLTTSGELFVGKPGYRPDRRGPIPRTIPTNDNDGLKYYKVPPTAF